MRRFETLAAAVAALIAILYFLIGIGVLYIGVPADGSAPDPWSFGASAGAAYLVVAALLLLVRRRVVWIAAALFAAMTVLVYFAAASVREPPFEMWGLLIKVCQVVLLGAVVYLVVRGPNRAAEGDGRVAAPAHSRRSPA